MTNREYIVQRLRGLAVTDAILADLDIDLEAEYVPSSQMGVALIDAIEALMLAPELKSVSENGFSMSWDRTKLGKWYVYLCGRYKRKPDENILPLLGISMITDISDQW